MPNKKREPRYRWACPFDWLTERLADLARRGAIEELWEHAGTLASQLDSDQIQDLFQSEMDADGYFKELR